MTANAQTLLGALLPAITPPLILHYSASNEPRQEGHDARSAALSAGFTPLRPVRMTALEMLIGMLPMSLGLGEGGEQNAPLVCAVMGGLAVATFATLFFVPVVYSLLRRKSPQAFAEEEVALAEQDVAVTTTSYRYQAAAIRCCAICLLPRHRPVALTERVIDTTIASHYNGAQEPFCL